MQEANKSVTGGGNAPRVIAEFASDMNKPHNMIKIDQQFADSLVRALVCGAQPFRSNGNVAMCRNLLDMAEELQRQIDNQV